jgi:hypothetical protein
VFDNIKTGLKEIMCDGAHYTRLALDIVQSPDFMNKAMEVISQSIEAQQPNHSKANPVT